MCLAALRMLLNGMSLILQNRFPERGVTANYGNEQLFFRSIVRFSGIPLYAAVTLQAISDLNGTQWERPPVELVINLIRCSIIIPISWVALAHQWRYTGTATFARCTPQGSLEFNPKGMDISSMRVGTVSPEATAAQSALQVVTEAKGDDGPRVGTSGFGVKTATSDTAPSVVGNGFSNQDSDGHGSTFGTQESECAATPAADVGLVTPATNGPEYHGNKDSDGNHITHL